MALILEVRDPNGVSTLHRLNSPSITIGRALSNDIILDDPYVDARHAEIVADEAGGLELQDTGSVNGIYVGDTRARTTVSIQAGVAVRVGRSTLKFRDINEAVAPALVDGLHALSERPAQRTFVPTTPKWQWAILGTACAVFLVNYWLGSTARDGWTPAISGTIGVFIALSLWSVIWGAATRGADRKLNFMRHLVIASTATLALFLLFLIGDYSQFLFPGAEGLLAFPVLSMLAVSVVWIVEHLAVSTVMTSRKRWRAGVVTAGFVVLAPLLISKSRDARRPDDEASISTTLKPLDDRFVPANTVQEFAAALIKLRKEVDKEVDKELEKQGTRGN